MVRSGAFRVSPRLTAVGWLAVAFAASALVACGQQSGPAPGRVLVVAAENFWGSIAGQIGGAHVQLKSIIVNPDTDPHEYEPTPSDGRAIASAEYVIVNGAGYDPWAGKLVDANPAESRTLLDVGRLNRVAAGGNPHMWYSPAYVARVIDQVTADLKRIDPSDESYFDVQRTAYLSQGLARYDSLRAQIRLRYASVAVGATESIVVYLAADLGLDLTSPQGFMSAISEGNEPTAADKAAFDRQVESRQIKVLVFNSQNSTPDVQALVRAARGLGIPVVALTETLSPASATFQDWQSAQLQDLATALAAGIGQ